MQGVANLLLAWSVLECCAYNADAITQSATLTSDLDVLRKHSKTHALLQGTGAVLQTPTTTTYESWFSRLGDSFKSVIAGLVLIPLSLSFLWVNEQRNARQESLISLGQWEVCCVDANASGSLKELEGKLVHMDSGHAKGLASVADKRFPSVKMDSGCLRLRSTVEAYQWEENKKDEKKKDRVGGGETTVTTYTYSQKWSASAIDSSKFNQRAAHSNTLKVPGLQPGTLDVTNGTVKYGESYYLPKDLVEGFRDFEDASSLAGESVTYASNTFHKRDGFYHFPSKTGAPQIGDIRTRFEYVLDGPASVLALQVADKQHEGSATFLPYRTVSRGFCFCGISEDRLCQDLLDEGRKTPDELYEEDRWSSGPFACLCCCCNLIAMAFAHFAPPQIYCAWQGQLSKKDCFDRVQMLGMAMKWGFRLLGWILLYAGTYALFEPLLVIIDIIPFLGTYISSGLSWVVGLFCFIVTAALATLVVSLGYLRYHPIIGLMYLTVVGIIVGGIVAISNASHQG